MARCAAAAASLADTPLGALSSAMSIRMEPVGHRMGAPLALLRTWNPHAGTESNVRREREERIRFNEEPQGRRFARGRKTRPHVLRAPAQRGGVGYGPQRKLIRPVKED